MPSKYFPQEIEKKWIDLWEKEQVYQTREPTDVSKKMYVLDMFPYPSGVGLHVGHPRGYTATDILTRFYRMNGFSVLHPMGWDAFGLPAENAAIKAKKNPMDMVPEHIASFKRQMKMLGFSYDWKREFATTDPLYYRWTQWLFIQFFKAGLLYKKDTPVYYCPHCKTGLSEEEVLPDGTHERCGTPITRKLLPQWVFRITSYADRLLKDIDALDWPNGIIEMQKNWIGKSKGAEIQFEIRNFGSAIKRVSVFTTRPDTIFGATALILAPEHPLIVEILQKQNLSDKKKQEIQTYIKEAQTKSDLARTDLAKEKTGVDIGTFAINPATKKPIPVWIADYVLGFYGSGAVMLVPAHDERDFEFAKKYRIGIKAVITTDLKKKTDLKEALTDEGYVIPSEEIKNFFKNLDFFKKPVRSEEFREKIIKELKKQTIGKEKIQYKLRDWIFSRQRYWGEPIPMIYCEDCARNKIKSEKLKVKSLSKEFEQSLYGWFPVEEKDLPVELPYLKSYEPGEDGKSPLDRVEDWKRVKCPNCSATAVRETDTMPNWAGSSWYFLRFADPSNEKKAWSEASMKMWEPVDWYFGGAEHAVLHLLYARFWVKAIYDLGLLNFSEPFLRLRNVGMILAADHRKMSKSLGNVLNPDEVVKEFGADSLRVYEMFMAPFSQEIAWSTQTLQGSYRFLRRIWQIYNDSAKIAKSNVSSSKDLSTKLQTLIQKVSDDIVNVKFNTAIAAMMEFLNGWEKVDTFLTEEESKTFLKLVSPFAPFITEEIWREVFKEKTSIHLSQWPVAKKKIVIKENLTIPVQINGKLRGVVILSQKETDEKVVVRKAVAIDSVKKYLEGKKYKVIYRPGKVINFVLS